MQHDSMIYLAFGALLMAVMVLAISLWKSRTSKAQPIIEVKLPEPCARPQVEARAADGQLSVAEIADRATPSVVVIEKIGEQGEVAGYGSGYVVASGIVVTNYHVIRGAKAVTIRHAHRGSHPVKTVLGYNVEHDLAALQLGYGGSCASDGTNRAGGRWGPRSRHWCSPWIGANRYGRNYQRPSRF